MLSPQDRAESIAWYRNVVTPGERVNGPASFPWPRYPGDPAFFQGQPGAAPVDPRTVSDPFPNIQQNRWNQYASGFPQTTRPTGTQTFQIRSAGNVTTAAGFVTVAERRLEPDREAIIETIAAQETALGQPNQFGLNWRVTINGSAPADFPPWVGPLGSLERGARVILRIPAGAIVRLQVADPAAPTQVQGFMVGFSTPRLYGKGNTSAGYEPRG